MRWSKPFALVLVVSLSSAAALAGTVSGWITADNHYALYTGAPDGSTVSFWGRNELGGGGSPGTYNWSMAEQYNVATPDPYIYIAAWSDDSVAQGLLCDLVANGTPIRSGDARWEVFATGINLNDGDPAPTLATMGTQIALANSLGWGPIDVGVANGASPWGAVANIDSSAKWMWHATAGRDAFNGGFDHDEFLIFRTSIPEPATLGLLAASLLGLRRRS